MIHKVIPHLVKYGKRKKTHKNDKHSLEENNCKYKKAYIFNFCRKLIYIIPPSRLYQTYSVDFKWIYPDIILFYIVGTALSDQCQFQDINRNCDIYSVKFYRVVFSTTILIFPTLLRHYCDFYSTYFRPCFLFIITPFTMWG